MGLGAALGGVLRATARGRPARRDRARLIRVWSKRLQYWPLFGLSAGLTGQRTDHPNCIELTPDFADFKHHYLLPGRTFSNDALGVPIGTKTRGGYAHCATFTLPSGQVGRSGTFYDESNIDNSNNTVNELKIDSPTLSEFCLNLITDNTAGEHNPDVQLEARSDTVDLGLAGNPDLSFDGATDMYTFRYTGMANGLLCSPRRDGGGRELLSHRVFGRRDRLDRALIVPAGRPGPGRTSAPLLARARFSGSPGGA